MGKMANVTWVVIEQNDLQIKFDNIILICIIKLKNGSTYKF